MIVPAIPRSTGGGESMTTALDLTIEIRSADGVATEFYETDGERIRKTLLQLMTPRLLTQPQLRLASEYSVHEIPTRAVDVILARTSTPAPVIFPLIFPAGLLDIAEVREDQLDSTGWAEHADADGSSQASPATSQWEIHTAGGWVGRLKMLAMNRGRIQGERRSPTHFLNLPAIPFRLEAGGIGLINPDNIIRVRVPKAGSLSRNLSQHLSRSSVSDSGVLLREQTSSKRNNITSTIYELQKI
jgi:hypothetical protein